MRYHRSAILSIFGQRPRQGARVQGVFIWHRRDSFWKQNRHLEVNGASQSLKFSIFTFKFQHVLHVLHAFFGCKNIAWLSSTLFGQFSKTPTNPENSEFRIVAKLIKIYARLMLYGAREREEISREKNQNWENLRKDIHILIEDEIVSNFSLHRVVEVLRREKSRAIISFNSVEGRGDWFCGIVQFPFVRS